MLPVAVTGSSSDGSAVHYVLPVLWTTAVWSLCRSVLTLFMTSVSFLRFVHQISLDVFQFNCQLALF